MKTPRTPLPNERPCRGGTGDCFDFGELHVALSTWLAKPVTSCGPAPAMVGKSYAALLRGIRLSAEM
jgi:hypothetical protein